MSTPRNPARPFPCPSCGTPSAGRFCTECGAVVGEARCASCGVSLTPGARFCHDCGAAAGATRAVAAARSARAAAPRRANNLPFIVGGVAFIALVVVFAAQRAGQAGTGPASMPTARAPDISAMSPEERASRLFDRIMLLTEQGKRDSAAFFASMALGVYESLGPLDADTRYDYGRVAEVSGSLDIAGAQADSILRQAPDHLLGLVLAITVAGRRSDGERRAALERQLLQVAERERARALDEYVRHKADIDAAIAAAQARR